MQHNYLEQGRRHDASAPTTPLEAFQSALKQVEQGRTDRVDLVTYARSRPWAGSGVDLYAPLVKQISQSGVTFHDAQIKDDLRTFFTELLHGEDGIERLRELSSESQEGTTRRTITEDHAVNVVRSHPFVNQLIWEIPVSEKAVIGLYMHADDSGPLAWAYYVGVPYKERSGLHGFVRQAQRSMSNLLQPIFDRNMANTPPQERR